MIELKWNDERSSLFGNKDGVIVATHRLKKDNEKFDQVHIPWNILKAFISACEGAPNKS